MRQFLATGEALNAPVMDDTGSDGSGEHDEKVISVQHGTGQAAVAAIGGRSPQIELKQVAVHGDGCLAQRSRDAADGGPICLRDDLA
jgi:hypothetical protein